MIDTLAAFSRGDMYTLSGQQLVYVLPFLAPYVNSNDVEAQFPAIDLSADASIGCNARVLRTDDHLVFIVNTRRRINFVATIPIIEFKFARFDRPDKLWKVIDCFRECAGIVRGSYYVHRAVMRELLAT